MRLKAIPLNIPDDDPFKEDKLSRKPVVELFVQLLSNTDVPLVITLNSPWGTGKTTVLRMLRARLRNEGFVCLQINALETDFTEDALNALTNELSRGIEAGADAKSDERLRKLKTIGTGLLKIGLPIALKIATGTVLPIPGEVGAGLGDLFSKYAKSQIDAYEKAKASISEFKKKLQAFADASHGQSDRKPVVILMDDLDRCRPTYALEMLEAAKHFFDVNGFVFVIAVDPRQLSESVRALYGAQIDTKEYLRRFVDLEYSLPRMPLREFCESLIQRFDMEGYFEKSSQAKKGTPIKDRAELLGVSVFLFTIFDFSLRTQEQCFTQLSLVLRSTPPGYLLHPTVVAVLLALKMRDVSTYRRIVGYEMSPAEIVEYLKIAEQEAQNKGIVIKETDTITYDYVEALFAIALNGEKYHQGDYDKLAQDASRGAAAERAKDVASILKQISLYFSHGYGIMGQIAKKIELTEKFVVE